MIIEHWTFRFNTKSKLFGVTCYRCGFVGHYPGQCTQVGSDYKCRHCQNCHIEKICRSRDNSGQVNQLRSNPSYIWADRVESDQESQLAWYYRTKLRLSHNMETTSALEWFKIGRSWRLVQDGIALIPVRIKQWNVYLKESCYFKTSNCNVNTKLKPRKNTIIILDSGCTHLIHDCLWCNSDLPITS